MSDAAYFDGWYADMAGRPARDAVVRRHLGHPPSVLPSGAVSWSGLAEVCAALRLRPGGRLVDLGCGRGSAGLELAARAGARLVGVDFSTVALTVALQQAAGVAVPARFLAGDLARTGLAEDSADAVVCLDSLQFAVPVEAALAEVARVLRPGGRLVVTCWQVFADAVDEGPELLCAVDLARQLDATGFTDVQVVDRPDWLRVERGLWEEAAATRPGDDPALRSLHEEGVRALGWWHTVRRVMATAEATPGSAGRPAVVRAPFRP